MMRPTPWTPERFWALTEPEPNTGCLLWLGYRNQLQYGTLQVKVATHPAFSSSGQWVKAHRVAWGLAHDMAPGPEPVLHRCDNPPCVEPSHLWRGSKADNTADMVAKGRVARGSALPHSKLTEEEVREIRRLRAEVGLSYSAIARRFSVCSQSVGRIVRRVDWRYL